jgi:HK97 family phage major capsid protein
MVQSDLAQVVGLAVDLAVLNGSGASGQPTGIISTAGIGSVTGTSIAYRGHR